MTELTKPSAQDRHQIEKSWFLFFPDNQTSYVHYYVSAKPGRSFARLIGNGLTTPNLADPQEASCLSTEPDTKGRIGQWHQASNSLKLVLCRGEAAEFGQCDEQEDGRVVHLALVHRKFTNVFDLPMQYERHFILWSPYPPFRMLATSNYPLLLANELASSWTFAENFGVQETEHREDTKRDRVRQTVRKRLYPSVRAGMFFVGNTTNVTHEEVFPNSSNLQLSQLPYFTHTTSISWAFRIQTVPCDEGRMREREVRNLQTGYLDDAGQAFAKVKASVVLECLRKCEVSIADDRDPK